MTLSLHPPLRAFTPENPSAEITSLRHLNVTWRSPSYTKPLPELLEDLKVLVKQKAVRTLIQFARVLAYKTFTREHKEAIVSWLALDCDNPKSNAYFVKVFARPFLTDKEFDKGCKELDRLTSSFPAVMEDLEQPQRRGMRR